MIELRTAEGTLDLSPDTVIELVRSNNIMLWDDDIKLDRVLPFDLPYTPGNRAKLKQVDVVDGLAADIRIPAELWAGGKLRMLGILNVLSSLESKGFRCNLTYSNELLTRDKMLQEFEFGGYQGSFSGDRFEWSFQPDAVKTQCWPDVPYCFPVFSQENFTYDYANMYNILPQTYEQVFNAMVPMFFAGWVVQMMMEEAGLKLEGSFYTDEELQKLIIFNTFNLNSFPGATPSQTPMKAVNHLPKISAGEFLGSLRKRFAMGMEIDTVKGTTRMVTLRDTLRNRVFADITDMVTGWLDQELRPASSPKVYEQEMDSLDGLAQWYKYPPQGITGEVDNFSDLLPLVVGGAVQNGDIYLVRDIQYIYQYIRNTMPVVAGHWQVIAYNYQNKKQNRADKMQDPSIGVTTSVFFNPSGTTWKVPQTEYVRADFEANAIDFSLRWLIYHKMQNTHSNLLYPYASLDNFDIHDTQLGDMDLRDEGTWGQYLRYKQHRERLESNTKCPEYILKPDSEFATNLKQDTLVRMGNAEFIWLEYSQRFTMRGEEGSRIRLHKI